MENLNDLTKEEKDYFELLTDFLDDGNISESERNILNKRKEKFGISEARAKEIEDFAKQERLANLKPQNDSEREYYELIFDFLDDGNIDESERNILNKRKNKYQISDSRAKELEEFAKQEYLESKKIKFETEGEKDYYEFVVDMLENGTIDESKRNILNKRKDKYQISDSRAKEIEEFAKQEYLESKAPQFETEGEKDYYNTLVYMLKDGTINESERFILNKRKEEYKISDSRAKELEDIIKDVMNFDNSGSSYENNKDSENNKVQKNYNYFHKQKKELNPKEAREWFLLGNSHIQNGQYKEAIKYLEKAVELNHKDCLNWYWLGNSYNQNGQYKEAIKCFKKATNLDSKDYLNWYWLGNSYNQNGQYKEAIECLEKAAKLNPNDYLNWHWLFNSYNQNGQYNEAAESLKKAIELNPDSDYKANLGTNCYKKAYSLCENNQYMAARKYLEQAVLVNPNEVEYWYLLGVSYTKCGQIALAKESFQKVLKLAPNNKEAKKNLEILKSK